MRWILLALMSLSLQANAAERFIVEDGQPRAEIVISAQALRTTRLAAHELQDYISKISGARLPIVTLPSGTATKIFVGKSEFTEQLGVGVEALKDGAYRIKSGADWLALVGEDTEFMPLEPWAKNNAEIVNGKAQAQWEQILGAKYGLPNLLIYKDRIAQRQLMPANTNDGYFWAQDERGSFNAVCGLLQRLGVRWFAPGEIGEVVPSLKSIALPNVDETVKPDFSVRRFNVRFAVNTPNVVKWAMRLGLRDPYGIEAAHGLDTMTNRDEVFAEHPDWFALYGGKRRFQARQNNQLCYSNEEFFRETVRYVRAQFDHFKVDYVSVMPPDGYTAICQCEKCAGQDSPEREQRGLASDYVWGFVNRVAKEVGKTHPHKKVLNCAYGIYTLPPLKIERLEPNVAVSIVGGRRPVNNRAAEQEDCRKLREAWLAKTSNPLIIFENYPFTDRGWYLPSFTPHSLGESINATKGYSQGEDIWLTVRQDFEQTGMGLNHFLIYFTQMMYWGGKNADVDALYRDYCHLFYGPAEHEMRAFFDYCEANWQATEKEKSKADEALALFAKAQAKAEPGSVYAKRLALIDDYLKGLRSKSAQLGRLRGPVPVVRLVGEARKPIVIDGKLDEEDWVNAFPSATVTLRELETGRQPIFGTTVKSAWRGNNLYIAFRCDERPGEKLNIGATKKDDSAMWYGDVVEVLLETESRSYYQIAVTPSGAIADLDRTANRASWFSWDSQVEVATHIADDHWTAELRFPITSDENDPLHQVIGRKPTRSLPWHINFCRQRIRDDGAEYSAFSPTGVDHFHEVMKFGTFFDGNSFQFEHGPPDDDFLLAMKTASEFARTGKRQETLAAYIKAAEGKYSVWQKSYTLDLAASTARGIGQRDVAVKLASQIPNEFLRKTATMQNLLESNGAADVVRDFAAEPLDKWPFWQRGAGYFARGRAFLQTKSGERAKDDLQHALEWTSDVRLRESIRLSLGVNFERNLNDPQAARAAYEAGLQEAKSLGSADQFQMLINLARLLSSEREFEAALKTLHRADIDKLGGYWRGAMLLAIAETQQAAGQTAEAKTTLQKLSTDAASDERHRQQAAARLKALQ